VASVGGPQQLGGPGQWPVVKTALTRSPMLGSSEQSYSVVKLFSKYFNLCDHGT